MWMKLHIKKGCIKSGREVRGGLYIGGYIYVSKYELFMFGDITLKY